MWGWNSRLPGVNWGYLQRGAKLSSFSRHLRKDGVCIEKTPITCLSAGGPTSRFPPPCSHRGRGRINPGWPRVRHTLGAPQHSLKNRTQGVHFTAASEYMYRSVCFRISNTLSQFILNKNSLGPLSRIIINRKITIFWIVIQSFLLLANWQLSHCSI